MVVDYGDKCIHGCPCILGARAMPVKALNQRMHSSESTKLHGSTFYYPRGSALWYNHPAVLLSAQRIRPERLFQNFHPRAI